MKEKEWVGDLDADGRMKTKRILKSVWRSGVASTRFGPKRLT
jgi:hypothetical protein